MQNIEEFCLELKNDIFSEIGENKNWDTAEYPMMFYVSGGGGGGLTILKKNGQETGRISQKKFGYFWEIIRSLIDPTKINKGMLTIYPNGEYESSFIWDEQAHLDYLILGVDASFSFIHEEIQLKIEDSLMPDTAWESIVITIPVKSGKVQPLQLEINLGEEVSYHSLDIKNLTYDEKPYLAGWFEDIYHLTNEGELKEKLSPKWNTAVISFNAIDGFDFKSQVKFEWREENA